MRLPLGLTWPPTQLAPAIAACALSFSLAGGPLPAFAAAELAPASGSPVAGEVAALVDKYYLDRTFGGVDLPKYVARLEAQGPLSDEQALDVSEKLVKSLGDRYSRILSPAEAVKLSKYDVTGVGINLVIADDGAVKVGAVPPTGSDALKAGIGFGDVVTSINGKSAVGMTSFDALEAIQDDGEFVALELKPGGGGGAARTVSLRKQFSTKNPVSYRLVETDGEPSVGYIQLREFNAQCKRRVREAVTELQARGASRLVLDLRGNGGGVLDGALGISGLFLDRPLVLYVTDANGSMQPLYSREGKLSSLPLELWVDKGSASSAEVLAASLRDNCRATVVGQKTYGKGVIQGVFGLSDGGALIETVASYSTPARVEINKLGVVPDDKHTFVSDVLGSSFVDADVRAATFAAPAKTCVAPASQPAKSEPAAENLVTR